MPHATNDQDLITVQVTPEENELLQAFRNIDPDMAFIKTDKGYKMAYLLGLVDKLHSDMEEESKAA